MASKTGIDPEIVRELAAILRETDLTEIEVEDGGLKLRIARLSSHVVTMHAPSYAPAPTAAPAPAPIAAAAPAAATDRTNPAMVPSPIVGTAYLSPEPGAPVFVSVGDSVTEGQTIMIVEAMKTMNPIAAPRAGKITKICVTDSQPVEYGEPLVILE
ncbi:MAG: acetyl-CoA carboxylase biotin carboxyl carrier protein [Caulobacterales bacterium]